MENVAAVVQYQEQQAQMAWVNANAWQFERPARQRPVRQAVVKTLLALATALVPMSPQEEKA